MEKKVASLCFLLDKENDKICLAMKKRGFGAGRWNGVGGKKLLNEDIVDTNFRETKEEIGVDLISFEKHAVLNFEFKYKPEWNQKVIVFVSEKWQGEPIESDEMLPRWFDIKNVPFDNMWPDDYLWLPLVLENKKITAEFLFGENDTVLDYKVNEIKKLPICRGYRSRTCNLMVPNHAR